MLAVRTVRAQRIVARRRSLNPDSPSYQKEVVHAFEELIEYLADAPPARNVDGKLLTTAALACLEVDLPWAGLSRGSARLVELLRPRP